MHKVPVSGGAKRVATWTILRADLTHMLKVPSGYQIVREKQRRSGLFFFPLQKERTETRAQKNKKFRMKKKERKKMSR